MNKIPVECIAESSLEGVFTPIKVRFFNQDESNVLKIDKVLLRDKKTIFADNNRPRGTELLFKCETIQDGCRKPINLYYNVDTCKWHIFVQ